MKRVFANFRGDVFGGITAGIVALPVALAFGVSSGLGPTAGLYGAIFLSFFAAIFGGTNTQISGPTAPTTAVSMIVIAGIVAANDGDLNTALPLILLVFLLAGIIQVLMGIIHLGEYIKYIPYPVVSGFMTAIGVMVILTQIFPMVGYSPKEDLDYVNTFRTEAEEILLKNILSDEAAGGTLDIEDFKQTISKASEINEATVIKESQSLAVKYASGTVGTVRVLPRALQNINWLELFLALGTIVIVFGFRRITTKIPSTLVALVIMSSIAVLFNFNYKSIDTIPSTLPVPKLSLLNDFNLSAIAPYIFTAFSLALLGAIDSLLTCVIADNMTKTKHKPNKELIGQGIGNSVAAIFGGIPGAVATVTTVVNINSGGKTRLSGMSSAIVLVVIILAFAPIASQIPAAVLAGVLVTVGVNVMDYRGLKAIPYLPKDIQLRLPFYKLKLSSEVIIMLVVLGLSTFWDLIYAVGIGLIMASLIFMRRIGALTASRSEIKSLKETIWADELNCSKVLKEKIYIEHLKGPLFFGSTSDFQALGSQIPESARVVIMRLGRLPYMDQSGLYAMEDMLLDLKKRHIYVLFVQLLHQPRFTMERIDLIPNLICEDRIFDNLPQSMAWIETNMADKL